MGFGKNKNLDDIIFELNSLLEPIEKEKMKNEKGVTLKFPVLFLVGTPRSGSTLFTQWAADTGLFAYPSNFLSRFYKAPYIGALIYQMVTDSKYQYRDEFIDINRSIEFSSNIGKTKGFKAPHEFWYFWRRFFDFQEPPVNLDEFKKKFDFIEFRKELILLQKVFQNPFLFKSHIINPYFSIISDHIDQSIILHLWRDPIASIRSLLHARKKWKGSLEQWFSWKPREFHILKEMDIYHQVAGQIYFIEKDIRKQKKTLNGRYFTLSYEEFCNNPKRVYHDLSSMMSISCSELDVPDYKGPERFDILNPRTKDDKHIKDSFEYFEQRYGKLVD